jgi:hypothetical protein
MEGVVDECDKRTPRTLQEHSVDEGPIFWSRRVSRIVAQDLEGEADGVDGVVVLARVVLQRCGQEGLASQRARQ